MGPVKLDNAVYFIRGLYDLADMARSKHDGPRRRGRLPRRPAKLEVRGDVVGAPYGQYADSLQEPATSRSSRSTGSARPRWRPSSSSGTLTVPRLAINSNGNTALGAARTAATGELPGNAASTTTGAAAARTARVILRTLADDLDPGDRRGQRWPPRPREQRDTMQRGDHVSERRTGGHADQMPGAMPATSPLAAAGHLPESGVPAKIDRCWTCRSSFMQAWGNYGTTWEVVGQQLGVRLFLPDSLLEVVRRSRAASRASPGRTSASGWAAAPNVSASHAGSHYTTQMSRWASIRTRSSATLCRRAPGRPW